MCLAYETKRLTLQILDHTFTEQVLAYYMGNREFLSQWEPWRAEEFYTAGFQKELLNEDIISIERGNMLKLWVFNKDDHRRVIGSVVFNNIIRGAFLSCHLGYKIDESKVNKGFATEAIAKGVEIIFNEFQLHRIEANIMPRNKSSLRVVEKLGFYNEGMAYKYLKISGRWENHIHMVLLNDEV